MTTCDPLERVRDPALTANNSTRVLKSGLDKNVCDQSLCLSPLLSVCESCRESFTHILYTHTHTSRSDRGSLWLYSHKIRHCAELFDVYFVLLLNINAVEKIRK